MSERCAASRHVELIAATLARGETYSMIEDDPPAVADSLQAVVQSLWKARADNARLRTALDRVIQTGRREDITAPTALGFILKFAREAVEAEG